MFLVQLFLPLYDNEQQPFPPDLYQSVRTELTERFGGLTAYTRAPAEGRWKDEEARTSRDDIIIYEVMVEKLERVWWKSYRRTLEQRFRQELLLVRASPIELL